VQHEQDGTSHFCANTGQEHGRAGSDESPFTRANHHVELQRDQ